MGSHLRKIRYLRHPYMITRAIILPIEERESQKHCLRLSEYARYSMPLEEGTEILAGIARSNVVRLMKELKDSNFLRHIELCNKQIKGIGGSMDAGLGQLLFILMRSLRPETVVETGVANGISSAFILKALDQNAKGRLYSIDLHHREGVATPLGRQLGWVIPEELRYRWSLILGESTRVLPKLLDRLISIDIFLHDSRHTYRTMMREYSIVWPYLNDGGLVLSDDVACNDAFLDFADRKRRPVLLGRIGAIVKKTS